MNNGRRSVGGMPYRRRHSGITVLESLQEVKLWRTLVVLLNICILLPAGMMKMAMVQLCVAIMNKAQSMRTLAWNALDPINHQHCNRGINSFTEEECYRHLRYRKADLYILLTKLGFPNVVVLPNGTSCSGEYALCLMLYRLHYPSNLALLQGSFGRDYTQLSRIFNYAIDFVYEHHREKVLSNIDWYADRFDLYNQAYNDKLASLPQNPVPGTVPAQLSQLFGALDCTANEICRPAGNNNAQNLFYNNYHHGHFIIWQGVTFPDGMVVLEGPEPGYFTDVMVWRNSQLRQALELIMQERPGEAASILICRQNL